MLRRRVGSPLKASRRFTMLPRRRVSSPLKAAIVPRRRVSSPLKAACEKRLVLVQEWLCCRLARCAPRKAPKSAAGMCVALPVKHASMPVDGRGCARPSPTGRYGFTCLPRRRVVSPLKAACRFTTLPRRRVSSPLKAVEGKRVHSGNRAKATVRRVSSGTEARHTANQLVDGGAVRLIRACACSASRCVTLLSGC